MKNYFGEYQAVHVAVFTTEGAKNAIQTAARGLGLSPEIGLYIASLVPQERGTDWSLRDCLHGNAEKDRKKQTQLINELNKYDGLLKVAENIEGLICGRGTHPGGMIVTNEDFTKHNAFMRAPKGQISAQFDLGDCEKMGRQNCPKILNYYQ